MLMSKKSVKNPPRDATLSPSPARFRKRSVTHAQLMHDKGRALQDFKRRMWLQELLDEVHTAEIRELAVRAAGTGTGGPSTTGSTLHSKPPGGTKNLPLGPFGPEGGEEEAGGPEPNMPQETVKSQPLFREEVRGAGKRRKKSRSGRRRGGGGGEGGDKRRRRARSLRLRARGVGDEPGSGTDLWLEWRSLLGLQRARL